MPKPPHFLQIFWLTNPFPLVGTWLRRRAARQLANDPARTALETLALFSDHSDPIVRAIVRERLDRVEINQAEVDAICRVWFNSRSAILGDLLERRGWVAATPMDLCVYSALQANRLDLLNGLGRDIIQPLLRAITEADQQLAERASTYLKNLSSQPAINALAELWLQSRNRPSSEVLPMHKYLEGLILSAGYVASAPLQARVLTALKAKKPELIKDLRQAGAPVVVDALNDPDPEIARQASQAIAMLERVETRDAVMRIYLEGEYTSLEEALLLGAYLPSHQADRALFLFLTAQWTAYEELDFDHSLLRTLYEAANPTLRDRILRALRQAGRVSYLAIITGREETERIPHMRSADFDLLTNTLINNREWPRLWVLAQKLPPTWSVRIIQSLARARWQPNDPVDQALLGELVGLVGVASRSTLLPVFQNLQRQTPPAVERARLHLHHGKLNSVAFHPSLPLLALVSSRRRVILWNYHTGVVERVIKTTAQGEPFSHSLGEVCYTHSGQLVFAERARNTEFCRIYAEVDGQVQRVFHETGSITALVPVGQNSILAAGRSMFITRLDLDHPTHPAARQVFNNWARGMSVSADGQTAALLQQGVTLIRTQNLERTAWGYGGGQVISAAAFTPDHQTLIAGRHNGEVHFFQVGDYMESEKRGFPRHRGPVLGIHAFQKYSLILTAGSEGMLRFTTWPERKRYSESGQDGDTVSGLSLSRDESALAVIHGEDRIALWDLRPLEIPALLSQPLATLTPIQFASLQSLAVLAGLPDDIHNAITFAVHLLHHRFRYDVEIESTLDIAPGEFDIEIGDLAVTSVEDEIPDERE